MTRFLFQRLLVLVPVVLLFAACDNPVHDDDHGDDIVAMELYDRANPAQRVAWTHGQGAGIHWDGGPLHLHPGESRELNVRFVNAHGNTFALQDGYSVRVRFAADAPNRGDLVRENATVRLESHGDHVRITGKADGEASIVFALFHGSHDDWVSPALRVEVDDH